MENKLLIFTYADINYDIFVLPYITFALNSNPEAKIEIAVEDLNNFNLKYEAGITQLRSTFGDSFLIRQSKVIEGNVDCTPNVVRFLEVPEILAEFVYIGDIDLMILDDILKTHTGYMKRFDLPFSNIIRLPIKNDQPRLTGLHFFRFEQMYPLPDISDLDLRRTNDEHILYLIMKRKGHMVPEDFRLRPECGVHLSTNRDPLGRYLANNQKFEVGDTLGWQIKTHHYRDKYIEVQKSKTYQACFMYFAIPFKLMLTALEGIFEEQSETLHRYALDFLVDKTFLYNKQRLDVKDSLASVDSLMADKKFDEAQSILLNMVNIWPKKVHFWNQLLNCAISNKNYELSKATLTQITSMHNGEASLSKSGLRTKFDEAFSTH
ncbi:hypothetical protein [Alteromonas gracilis]|uniref:hypothetical protein n=1 Tax=Alteromonas gracilis TaxID=1479524 RepID=UPI0030CED6FC